jgi:hypothetical protein
MTDSLDGLPRFSIDTVNISEDGSAFVEGCLEGWKAGMDGPLWFWLWTSDTEAITPSLQAVAPQGCRVSVRIEAEELAVSVRPGAALPWLSPYWQADHVWMIRRGEWQQRTFAAHDAVHFRLDGAHGWNRAEQEIPPDAVASGVEASGWDHEHCEICGARIGKNGLARGYVDPEDHWLCPACYERWAQRRDLTFLTT